MQQQIKIISYVLDFRYQITGFYLKRYIGLKWAKYKETSILIQNTYNFVKKKETVI